jgi:hypothetical protein
MGTSGDYEAPATRLERQKGVTDSNGRITFTWPVGAFAAAPVVTHSIEAASAGVRTARIIANTAVATTFEVLVTTGVTVLGISVLGPGVPAQGVTVHAQAVAP